jgi:hypothetical protein
VQNSPERLLTGIADTLRSAIAPKLTDPYALAQLQAAAEILDNLAPRVGLSDDLVSGSVEELSALFVEATSVLPDEAAGPFRAWLEEAPARRPAANWSGGLEALAGLQRWLADNPGAAPGLEERTAALIAAEFAREEDLVRTGMYRRGSGG